MDLPNCRGRWPRSGPRRRARGPRGRCWRLPGRSAARTEPERLESGWWVFFGGAREKWCEVVNEKKKNSWHGNATARAKKALFLSVYLRCPSRGVHDDLVTLLCVKALDGGADVGLHRG